MTNLKATRRILDNLKLNNGYEDYVLQKIGELGCEDDVDIETAKVIEQIVKKELIG